MLFELPACEASRFRENIDIPVTGGSEGAVWSFENVVLERLWIWQQIPPYLLKILRTSMLDQNKLIVN